MSHNLVRPLCLNRDSFESCPHPRTRSHSQVRRNLLMRSSIMLSALFVASIGIAAEAGQPGCMACGGVTGNVNASECLTCQNIWDGYCASKPQCLGAQGIHHGAGLVGAHCGQCGGCAAGGVGIYGHGTVAVVPLAAQLCSPACFTRSNIVSEVPVAATTWDGPTLAKQTAVMAVARPARDARPDNIPAPTNWTLRGRRHRRSMTARN